jgi:hypothetical protein
VLHLDGEVVRDEGDLVLHAKNYNREHRQGQGISGKRVGARERVCPER